MLAPRPRLAADVRSGGFGLWNGVLRGSGVERDIHFLKCGDQTQKAVMVR